MGLAGTRNPNKYEILPTPRVTAAILWMAGCRNHKATSKTNTGNASLILGNISRCNFNDLYSRCKSRKVNMIWRPQRWVGQITASNQWTSTFQFKDRTFKAQILFNNYFKSSERTTWNTFQIKHSASDGDFCATLIYQL